MKPIQPSPPAYYGFVVPKPKRAQRWEAIARFVHAQVAWIVSTAVHVVLLLLLALIVISGDAGKGIRFFSGDTGGDSELQLAPVDLNDSRESALAADAHAADASAVDASAVDASAAVATQRNALQSLDLQHLTTTSTSGFLESSAPMESDSSITAHDIQNSDNVERTKSAGGIPMHKGMTSGRSGPGRASLLKKYGGTEQTEAAVRKGIEWLMKQQATDGSWSFMGPYTGGARFGENQAAATSMALLAILGAGHTHKSGDYRKEVENALKWLVNQQDKNGDLGVDTPRHHALYTHAQATLALCEAYAMTDDSWLRPYCEKAANYAVRSQGLEGGWRYEPRGDSDTSVTGWFLVALISARSCEIEVPEASLRRISGWLNRVDRDSGATYSYVESMKSTPSMSAEGLLCRMYLGWERSRPPLEIGANRLLKSAPFNGYSPDYYYWYYATQVMHHLGGKVWEKWNSPMREQLPKLQVSQEPELGSWPPGDQRFDQMAGRLYCTCMALCCLEVYYRHMPIYDSPWNSGKSETVDQ